MDNYQTPSADGKTQQSILPSDPQQRTGYLFKSLTVSDHGLAVCGNVYMGCSDFMHRLTPEEEQKGNIPSEFCLTF